jgi:hypothetical protein
VELIQAGVLAVTGELNLELHLVALHGQVADHTHRTNSGTAPCAIRAPAREFAAFDYCPRFLAE